MRTHENEWRVCFAGRRSPVRSLVTHAVIAAQHKQRFLSIPLVLHKQILEQPPHDIVHLSQLRSDKRTSRTCKVSDVIEAQIVKDHDIPRGTGCQVVVEVSSYIVIHLEKENLLYSKTVPSSYYIPLKFLRASVKSETKNEVVPSNLEK